MANNPYDRLEPGFEWCLPCPILSQTFGYSDRWDEGLLSPTTISYFSVMLPNSPEKIESTGGCGPIQIAQLKSHVNLQYGNRWVMTTAGVLMHLEVNKPKKKDINVLHY